MCAQLGLSSDTCRRSPSWPLGGPEERSFPREPGNKTSTSSREGLPCLCVPQVRLLRQEVPVTRTTTPLPRRSDFIQSAPTFKWLHPQPPRGEGLARAHCPSWTLPILPLCRATCSQTRGGKKTKSKGPRSANPGAAGSSSVPEISEFHLGPDSESQGLPWAGHWAPRLFPSFK